MREKPINKEAETKVALVIVVITFLFIIMNYLIRKKEGRNMRRERVLLVHGSSHFESTDHYRKAW